MQKLTPIFAFIFFSTFIAQAQVGDPFPEMSGITLTDQQLSVPTDTEGKFTLIGLAYSKKAEDDLKSWFQPIYNEYVRESDPGGLIPDMGADVNVVFVPMFTGIKQGASKAATKKMKKGIDEKLHPHVLVYSGKLGDYKEALDFEKKDTPYFFVIDKSGKIVYATSGKFSVKKLNEIDELVGGY
ncbi:hypothetical protein JKA74_18775 [Marivirga sp. S37H4]|uniref:Thioredoxin domain-containing protein n=1 Tax=Marivirga aurantiaca TaxID=2802615 RepID=A0A934X263_9BACT|nr:hypothetical protein [Marivirga aurantiaca]MBK6267096.1 hypothetical protein [Marivirga aurantiaca]